jgi:hypothetical protein
MASQQTKTKPRAEMDQTNPKFSPGRTTRDADMAEWAYEHRLWLIKDTPKPSVHGHQMQEKASRDCAMAVEGSDELCLLDTAEMPLRFIMQFDSLGPRFILDLHYSPKPAENANQHDMDSWHGPTRRIRAEFPAYGEYDFDQREFLQRRVEPFDPEGTPAAGPLNFSRHLRDVEWKQDVIDTDERAARLAPRHWLATPGMASGWALLSWRFEHFTRYNWILSAGQTLGPAHLKAIDRFQRILDACLVAGPDGKLPRLQILVRGPGGQQAKAWRRFASIPCPMPQPYWPWVRRLDPIKLLEGQGKPTLMAMNFEDRHQFELDYEWIARALADRSPNAEPGTTAGKARRGAVTVFRQLTRAQITKGPVPLKRLGLRTQYQFSGSAEYLAHIVGGFMYTVAAEDTTHIRFDGMLACTVIPDVERGSATCMVLLRLSDVGAAAEGTEAAVENTCPDIGTPANLRMEDGAEWQGTVVAMPARLGKQYDLAIRATLPAVASKGRPTTRQTRAEVNFGWAKPQIGKYQQTISDFFLDGANGYQRTGAGRFLHRMLMGRMTRNMNDLCTALGDAEEESMKKRLKGANSNQRQAVRALFANPFTLLHGPPGTGKSSTIGAALQVAVDTQHPVAFFAASNEAVDVIVDGFVKNFGTDAEDFYRLRPTVVDELAAWGQRRLADLGDIGAPEGRHLEGVLDSQEEAEVWRAFVDLRSVRAAPLSLGATLCRRMDMEERGEIAKGRGEKFDGEAERLAKIRKLQKNLDDSECMALVMQDEGISKSLIAAREAQHDIKSRVRRQVARCFRGYVRCAKGIFATFGKSTGALARAFRARIIIIDEASQALEGSTIFPLVFHVNSLRHIMLVGDHKQLPPCVMTDATTNPFQLQCQMSLFERLMVAGFPCVTRLSEQYRMHPSIARIVNDVSYDGRLVDGANTRNPNRRHAAQAREWVRSMWARCPQTETAPDGVSVLVEPRRVEGFLWGSARRAGSKSSSNLQTAAMSVLLAFDVLTRLGLPGSEVYIATFYKDQRALIEAMIAGLKVFAGVAVVIVDGSQGRERDVVVLDCVRLGHAANESQGFLGLDQRRFNVAMSRARTLRVVVAHTGFMQFRRGAWAAYFDDARRHREVFVDDGSFFGYRAGGCKHPELVQLLARVEKTRATYGRDYSVERAQGGAGAAAAARSGMTPQQAARRREAFAAMAAAQTGRPIRADEIDAAFDIEDVVMQQVMPDRPPGHSRQQSAEFRGLLARQLEMGREETLGREIEVDGESDGEEEENEFVGLLKA